MKKDVVMLAMFLFATLSFAQSEQKVGKSIIPHVHVDAGLSFVHLNKDRIDNVKDHLAPRFGLGVDFDVPRLSERVRFNVIASTTFGKSQSDGGQKKADVDFLRISAQLGASYYLRGQKDPVRPMLKGGLELGYSSVEFDKFMSGGGLNHYPDWIDHWRVVNTLTGVYAGLGADFTIGKGELHTEVIYSGRFKLVDNKQLMIPSEVSLCVGWIF